MTISSGEFTSILHRNGAMELTSLAHLDELVESTVDPVILVECTRNLPEGAGTLIREFGSFLASRNPSAIFRTGNATGKARLLRPDPSL